MTQVQENTIARFSLADFKRQHLPTLEGRLNRNLERLMLLEQESIARFAFCEERGNDLNKAIAHFVRKAAPPNAEGQTNEQQFVIKTATERAEAGFTMEELPGLAEKAGMIDANNKEQRKPIHQAFLDLQAQNVFRVAEQKRDGKTVFVLATLAK